MRTRFWALLMMSLFVLSTAAFATGPAMISGNLGEQVIVNEMANRENRFRQSCYFTSQGAICPTLSPVLNRNIETQRVLEVTPSPVRSATDVVRTTTYVEDDDAENTASRPVHVTSIRGRPGAFSRWARSKRNYRNICYTAASGTQKGNLVCGSPGVTDYGKHPLSFRPHIEKRNQLSDVGRSHLGADTKRKETSHQYAPYKLTN